MKSEPKHRDETLRKLNVSIKDWENIWKSVFPQTDDSYIDNTENIAPEGFILDCDKNPILLRFPSEFHYGEEITSDLEQLRKMEMELRIGEAFDALKSLRQFLGLKSFLTRQKYNPNAPKGLAVTLRSADHSTRAQTQIERFKATYRRNWARLQDLTKDCAGNLPNNFKRLRDLADTDCRTLAEWTEDDRQRKAMGERQANKQEEKGVHPDTCLGYGVWNLKITILIIQRLNSGTKKVNEF